MLGFDWKALPHKFIGVTAGAPRSCATSMKTLVDERMQMLGETAKMYRLVKDRDIVPKVPPTFLSFQHLGPPVSIDEDGTILVKEPTFADTDGDVESDTLQGLTLKIGPSTDEGDDEEEGSSAQSKYEKWIGRVPKSLRDHMPEL